MWRITGGSANDNDREATPGVVWKENGDVAASRIEQVRRENGHT
ncbi:hypothetical protein [Paenibacillus typhae]|uniref:Uncharacterized protein n=1 Tax=Paenibacillus typhae TaxID=1174501 RepID=A0A1G8TTM0_9BACL|nr:hypothetical protein [Paenibacillus typhae]SDJ44881.1 hypothetical protein SAMN05216192_11775 [Paenibacillus typhae]